VKLTQDALKIDVDLAVTRIKRFINDYVEKTKAKGVVVAVSGGIDSCTTIALSALAIGGNEITALYMPEEETYSSREAKHAKQVADRFKFRLETIDITPIFQALYKVLPIYDEKAKLSRGNLKARTRMLCLYYYANRLGKIVCGSSDKSETMMGYFTKWGDVAADISPLMDLYKTQVRLVAAYIGIPKEIISKPSTPQLWPGHLAEQELGIKYEILDLILLGLENFMSIEEIAEQLHLEVKFIKKIKDRWLASEHKRRPPLTLKQEFRTIGTDFRLPYTPSLSDKSRKEKN
jgi:NAD+ synthase